MARAAVSALRLVAAAESLSENPLQRPIDRRRPPRPRQAIPAMYLIRYRIRDETVEIITIRHGARRPAP